MCLKYCKPCSCDVFNKRFTANDIIYHNSQVNSKYRPWCSHRSILPWLCGGKSRAYPDSQVATGAGSTAAMMPHETMNQFSFWLIGADSELLLDFYFPYPCLYFPNRGRSHSVQSWWDQNQNQWDKREKIQLERKGWATNENTRKYDLN